MDFLSQLKTLLWKNYVLRRKKKLRLIAELIWPLIIFSVLVIIKIRFNNSLITEMEECHFEDMSLPSAGLFSFLRSYYCNVDIPCYSKVKDGLQVLDESLSRTAEDQIRNLLLSDKIFEVTNEFESFFNLLRKIKVSRLISELTFVITNDKHAILQCQVPLKGVLSFDTLMEPLFLKNSSLLILEFYEFANSFSKNKSSLQMFSVELLSGICNNKKILKFSDEERLEYCNLEPERSLSIFKEVFSSGIMRVVISCFKNLDINVGNRVLSLVGDLSSVLNLRTQLNKTMEYFQEIRNLIYSDNGTSSDISFRHVLCGPTSKRNTYTFLKLLNPSGMISTKAFKSTFFAARNKSSNFCNQMMAALKILKQFMVGKIVYTPVTESIKKIIERANNTFENVERLMLIISDIKALIPDLIELSKNVIFEEAKVILTMYSVVNFSMADQLLPLVSADNLQSMLKNLNEALELALQFSECFDFDKFVGVETEEELNKLGHNLSLANYFLAGLVFSEESKSKLSHTFRYKIRLDQTFVDLGFKYNIEGETKRGSLPTNPRIASRFMRSGFVFIQDLVEHAILTMEMQSDNVGSVVQMFPSPCYVEDVFKLVLVRTFPLFMTLAWLIMVPIIVKDIVYEKEMKLKEFLKVMGLSKSVHWVSWFVFYFCTMSVSVLLLSLLIKFGNILQYANIFLVILFLLIFLVALISQCFMFSVFFNLSNAAASFSAVVYFAAFLPFRIFVFRLDSMHHWHKLIASLSFTTAFGFGCNSLAVYESRREGMQWHSVFSHPTKNDRYSFGTSMMMMLFDSFLYLAIALYVEAVFPGEYGQAKPWHFLFSEPFKRLNVCKMRFKRKNKSLNNSLQLMNHTDDHFFETNRDNLPVGVQVQNLIKRYSSNQPPAVDNLTMEFYESQISGLLGHNGAGKTTTMFIMTGLLPATQGTVFVKNFNVATDIRKIRKIISFCPQHNILYDYLSVWQHLQFYSKLRGLSGKELDSECNRVMADVKLSDKKDTEARHLSGGMKRRLSVGIAYLGSPEVVILDEPTAGVDARARRFIWDLLLMYKLNRTTILSTHLMEEAEVLSDRLAIINRGRLYCSGSLMYLKNHFASGYRLTTEIHKESVNETLKVKLADLVIGSVTDAEIDNTLQIPQGETFILPLKSTGQFPTLFKRLEENRAQLCLTSYGISSPTVEEIFVNINETVENRDDLKNNSAAVKLDNEMFKPCPNILKNSGIKLQFSHLTSLMMKRFYYFKRNKKTIFCQLILPPIFVMALVLVLKFAFDLTSQNEELHLHPRIHAEEGGDSLQQNFFVARKQDVAWDPEVIEKSLIEIFGSNDDCLDVQKLETPKTNSCQSEHLPRSNLGYSNRFRSNFTVDCDCSTGFQKCKSEASGTLPKSASLLSGSVVYNLTHFDIPDYLLKTHQQFHGRRFGGFEFASTEFPRDPAVEIVVGFLNVADSVSLGMGRNISRGIVKLVDQLRAISPALLSEYTAKVWFNYEKPASMITYLNSLHNAFTRSGNLSTGNGNGSRPILKLYDHPLNSTGEKNALAQSILEILPPVSIMFAVTIIPTSFLIFLIDERQSGFMHLQLISGVHPTLYWLSNFAWDFICYAFTSSICFLIFYFFHMEEFTSPGNAPAFVSLLFMYGLAVIPLTYFFTFVFEDGNTAYVFTSGGYFFCGLIPSIVMFVLDFIPDTQDTGRQLEVFFAILPQFCLGRGLMEMTRNQMSHSSSVALLGADSVSFKSPLAYELVGKFLIALAVFSFVSVVLFLALVNRLFEWCSSNNRLRSKRNANLNNSGIDDDDEKEKEEEEEKEEDDVLEEERRIDDERERNVLVVRGVTKTFGSSGGACRKPQQTKALDRISFGVREAECFGLLGTNGAGKTTLFRILTGDIRPTSGDAYIDGKSVSRSRSRVRTFFGYCPQFDALCNLMTVREHLVLFARLRGASGGTASEICQWGLKNLDLMRNKDTLSKNLSGGNKRKLSVALSLIGRPRIVYMDEPTAGIDPRARRSVWNCILGTVAAGQSVVLTSHSLEECESLCSRASIVVSGSLRCIGTVQHLKSKYAEGYNLSVKFAESAGQGQGVSTFERLLYESLSDVVKKEEHDKFRSYSLLDVPLDLGKVFAMLLEAKGRGEIEDFSINQTTLEQVFLKFASEN